MFAFQKVSLAGKTFLDVGCGSGIHSLAAVIAGALRVVSFDYDADAVQTTETLRQRMLPDAAWKAFQGSMIDESLMSSLGQFDIVYCWGAAHHTGDMWRALALLSDAVSPGGYLHVAIYNTVDGRAGSAWWWRVKHMYVSSGRAGQKVLEWSYLSWKLFALAARLQNPWRVMKEYKDKRGMSWATDAVDWLGGYPYEHARPEEIFRFFHERGFVLENLKTTNYIGCNEFLFRKAQTGGTPISSH